MTLFCRETLCISLTILFYVLQQIWLSYGEDYKSFVIPVLSLQVQKAEGVLINSDEEEETVKIYADTFNVENLPEGSDK